MQHLLKHAVMQSFEDGSLEEAKVNAQPVFTRATELQTMETCRPDHVLGRGRIAGGGEGSWDHERNRSFKPLGLASSIEDGSLEEAKVNAQPVFVLREKENASKRVHPSASWSKRTCSGLRGLRSGQFLKSRAQPLV